MFPTYLLRKPKTNLRKFSLWGKVRKPSKHNKEMTLLNSFHFNDPAYDLLQTQGLNGNKNLSLRSNFRIWFTGSKS